MFKKTTRRQVVEEEVTEEVTSANNSFFETYIKPGRRERMKYEYNRLQSLGSGWLFPHHLDINIAQRLVKSGFCGSWCTVYTECFSCELRKAWSFWLEEGPDPETVHRELRPDCEFVTSQSDNVPIREQMKYERHRLDSFNSGWVNKYPLELSVAQRLARAGFYHQWFGHTKCFSCELHKNSSFWEEAHDAETVHREESPDCKFTTGQSDNVPTDNELQDNSKTSTDTSYQGVKVINPSKIKRSSDQITIKPSYNIQQVAP